MLTEARNRPGAQRSVLDDEVRRRRGTELVAGVDAGVPRPFGSHGLTPGGAAKVPRVRGGSGVAGGEKSGGGPLTCGDGFG
jgi:hypothetical protein